MQNLTVVHIPGALTPYLERAVADTKNEASFPSAMNARL